MASTSHSFSVSRFTYVPNEQFPTIEAAFSSKPLPEWILVPPHASFTLVIDQTVDRVVMKCLDGQDIRVFASLNFAIFSSNLAIAEYVGLICHQKRNFK
jgi:hypothetical protein